MVHTGCKERFKLKNFLILSCALLIVFSVSASENINVSGYFERYVNGHLDSDSAHINIVKQGMNEYSISGSALWIISASTGSANVGEIRGVFPLKNGTIRYDIDNCNLLITFTDKALVVSDDNLMCGGMNISFNGTYIKRSHKNESEGK